MAELVKESFKNSNDDQLSMMKQTDENAKAVIVFTHGLGEHIGRYEHVFNFFVANGYSCYGFDHQGHGNSYGPKGHVMDYGDYRSDLNEFIELAINDSQHENVYLLGHSMGGLVALGYAMRQPEKLKGLIVTSPGLLPKTPVPKIKDVIGRLFGKLIPTLTQPNGLDLNGLAKDKKVIELYQADPLVHDRASAAWYLAWMNESEWVRTHLKLEMPALIMTGLADLIIDPNSIIDFYNNVSCEDKTLKQYDTLRHEIMNEKEQIDVFADILNWLKQH